MSSHRIGILFSSPNDRRLLTRFLRDEGYECWAPSSLEEVDSSLVDQIAGLSLVLVEERVASRLGSRILEERSAFEPFLPVVAALQRGTPSSPWLREGFDDVLRLPLEQDELRARLKVMLRHQERSVASLGRANNTLRSKNRELNEARRAAEAANKAKTEFLANVSHELRTPLHGILGSVEILKLHPQCEKQREMIELSGRSLLTLVEDLLDYASLEAGQLRIHPRPFVLAKQLEAATASFREKAVAKNLDFSIRVDPNLPSSIETDPARFSQIVSNLVGNAVKFTQRGSVSVSLKSAKNGMEIEVRDTGLGIAEDQREQIFQPFHQADASTTRSYEGTGLGLAIVSRIVAAMEGALTLESEPDRGSLFRVALPVKAAHEPAAEEKLDETGRPLNILVVEDNPINSAVMKRLLGIWGHHAEVASSGQQGLDCWQQSAHDLILMDLQMPHMSGLEATRKIRETEREQGQVSEVPIIALTARTREGDRELCLRSGMTEYMTKPPNHQQLRALISKLTSD